MTPIEEMSERHLAMVRAAPLRDPFTGFPPPMKSIRAMPPPEPIAPPEGKTYGDTFHPLSARLRALDKIATAPVIKSLVEHAEELEKRVSEAELRASLYRSQLLRKGRWGLWWDEINLKLARWLLR